MASAPCRAWFECSCWAARSWLPSSGSGREGVLLAGSRLLLLSNAPESLEADAGRTAALLARSMDEDELLKVRIGTRFSNCSHLDGVNHHRVVFLLQRLSQQLKLAKQKTDRLTRQIRQATVPAAGVAPDNNVDAGTSSNAKVRQERAMAFLEEAPPLDPKRSEMLTASIFAAAVGIDKWAVPRSLWEKLTEHPNCRPADVFQGNEDTQRGHALEPTARRAYECQFGILAPPCGLHTHCDPTLGWLGAWNRSLFHTVAPNHSQQMRLNSRLDFGRCCVDICF
eukprot:SAG31_NODE_186_length_20918_cov_26.890917_9_plen_282_part_00